MKFVLRLAALTGITSVALTFSSAAQAYVGPGAGLGVIGTIVAFLGAIFLAIVGFVWYPIKRLLKKRKPAAIEEGDSAPVASADPIDKD